MIIPFALMKFILLITALISLLATTAQRAEAQAAAPAAPNPQAWLDRVSHGPPGPNTDIRPTELTYELSWKGRVKAGNMTFRLTEPHQGVYRSEASGKSTGLARALFPYDFSGASQTHADTLKPMAFNFKDKMKTKSYTYKILFQPNQMISETDLKDHKTGVTTPYRRVYRFNKDVGMDMMSALLYMRSLELKQGEKISIVTATFNKPYLVDFTVLGREKKKVKRTNYNAIKLDMKIHKIHSDMTIERYDKIERATIWVSDDEYRIPIEMQGDIFIGYICSRLSSRRFL